MNTNLMSRRDRNEGGLRWKRDKMLREGEIGRNKAIKACNSPWRRGGLLFPSRIYSGLEVSELHESYWVTQKLPQIYTANHATFPMRKRKVTVQICGNFWVTQCH